MTSNQVNQSEASAEGDIVGRDKIINVDLVRNPHVKALVERLRVEMDADQCRHDWIDGLTFFEEPIAPDGVAGLEAKLIKSGRSGKLEIALKQKELFAKFLSSFSLYESAQELLALCLHRIHAQFETKVHPHCQETNIIEIDDIIMRNVVDVIVNEYSLGAFSLNHGLVQGMIYWLAERCYVRWHTL